MDYDRVLFVWDVSPVLFSLGPVTVRWYGLLFALAFIAGLYMMHWIYQHEQRKESELDSLFLYVLAGTIIGARLGHVLFYAPEYYLQHPLEILQVWEGGLASHGGTVGILVAVFIYSRKEANPSMFWIMDRLCIVTAMAAVFIRLGNFFNSEIIGLPVNGGVVFKRFDSLPRHPVQLYESAAYLLIFVLSLFLYRRFGRQWPAGRLFGIFLIALFGARLLLEVFKTRQAVFAQEMMFSVGQWLSVPFVLFGLYLIMRKQQKA